MLMPIPVEVSPSTSNLTAPQRLESEPPPVPPPQLPAAWPIWQRVGFRFFFVYLLLQIAPWNWVSRFAPMAVGLYWSKVVGPAVHWSNDHIVHVRDRLVPVNGSGDTSFAWAQLWLYLIVAVIAMAAWSVIDRRRPRYDRAAYWLRTIVRYYIATFALSYGIIKIFALQMPFPTLSQLSTPLGDLLPMRLSWLFIGYSTRYQVFSGLAETAAGLLLLNRRTVTAGLFVAAGAFTNVVMINLSYDVPVKLFAMHLLLACLFLLALDAKRLLTFLVLNRPVDGTRLYEPYFSRSWQRFGGLGLKAALLWGILIVPFRDGWRNYQFQAKPSSAAPFAMGVYDVQRFVVNRDTIPPLVADTMRWRDVIFDGRGAGSVNSTDPVFWQRYRRGYFRYAADTAAHTLAVWKTSAKPQDSTYLFSMRYDLPDSMRIRLWTKIRDDSIYAELVRTNRHFQLAERQFHWLSEYNR